MDDVAEEVDARACVYAASGRRPRAAAQRRPLTLHRLRREEVVRHDRDAVERSADARQRLRQVLQHEPAWHLRVRAPEVDEVLAGAAADVDNGRAVAVAFGDTVGERGCGGVFFEPGCGGDGVEAGHAGVEGAAKGVVPGEEGPEFGAEGTLDEAVGLRVVFGGQAAGDVCGDGEDDSVAVGVIWGLAGHFFSD